MPKAKKSTAERLAVINGHALRRQIMQAAQEAHAQGRLVSPTGLHKQLGAPIGKVSYHVTILRDEGALKLMDRVPRRGAVENLYGIDEDLLAEITDSIALDRAAELLDEESGFGLSVGQIDTLKQIIRATGRPVEA